MSSRPVCLPGQASSISSLHSPASGYRPSKCLQMHRCHAAPGHLVWGFPRRYSLGREPEYFRVTCNLQFIRREFRAAGWARWAICRDAKCLFPTELNLGCLFLQSVKRTAACTAVPCTHHGAVPPLLSSPPPTKSSRANHPHQQPSGLAPSSAGRFRSSTFSSSSRMLLAVYSSFCAASSSMQPVALPARLSRQCIQNERCL